MLSDLYDDHLVKVNRELAALMSASDAADQTARIAALKREQRELLDALAECGND